MAGELARLRGLVARAAAIEREFGVGDELVNIRKFGARGDGVTDDTIAFNAAVSFCASNGARQLYLPAGRYRLASEPNALGGVLLTGDGCGSDVTNGSWLIRDYVEKDDSRGFLCWNGYYTDSAGKVIGQSTGGGAQNIGVLAPANSSGGIGILLTGDPKYRAGYLNFTNVKCYGQNGGAWFEALRIDGSKLIDPAAAGVRDCFFNGCTFATASHESSTVVLRNAYHAHFAANLITAGSVKAPAGLHVTGDGKPESNTTNMSWHGGTIAGDLTMDNCARCCVAAYATNVKIDAATALDSKHDW